MCYIQYVYKKWHLLYMIRTRDVCKYNDYTYTCTYVKEPQSLCVYIYINNTYIYHINDTQTHRQHVRSRQVLKRTHSKENTYGVAKFVLGIQVRTHRDQLWDHLRGGGRIERERENLSECLRACRRAGACARACMHRQGSHKGKQWRLRESVIYWYSI